MARSRILLALVVSGAWLGFDVSQSHARSDRIKGARPFESSAETVDLFQGVEEGTLSVKVIPHDSKECRIFVTNETNRELNVQMPGTLAAVPVLAQLPLNGPGQGQNNLSTPQRLGVGNPFGQQNPLQMGPNMQGGPMMNQGNQPFFAPFCVAPEKVAQLRLPTVCLDHGHPDPRPAIPYHLVPLNAVSESKELELLCRQLGWDPMSQRIAQAAAWHFSNGKPWEEMESMVMRRLGQPNQSFFSRDEIKTAKAFVETLKSAAASKRIKARSSVASTH